MLWTYIYMIMTMTLIYILKDVFVRVSMKCKYNIFISLQRRSNFRHEWIDLLIAFFSLCNSTFRRNQFFFWLRMYSHGLRACVNVTAHFLFFLYDRTFSDLLLLLFPSLSLYTRSVYARRHHPSLSLRLYNLHRSFTRSYCCF
jgi:hypothetical protein